MAKFTNEMKTGIVVAIAAVFLLYVLYKIGGISTEKGYEQKCVFNYVSGLEENAPVKLAGVKVGEVRKIGFTYDGDQTKVQVSLFLNEAAKIREDSRIGISTTGLIGEKYIEISGGSKGSPFVKKGLVLQGVDFFEMEQLIARLDSAMQDLQKLMGDADGVLVENKNDIRTAVMNLKDTSDNFKEFSDEIKRNPWKLLVKGKEVTKEEAAKEKKK